MNALFEIQENTYNKCVVSIINIMLSRLKNNKPKQDSKVYAKNAGYILELYDGTFLSHKFNCDRKDYNYSECFSKIKLCKGSWQAIRNLIVLVLDNIDLAKDKSYMPFNKNFVNSITFGTFFEYFNPSSLNPGINSNFINFINPPKKCYEYTSNITIEKLKSSCISLIRDYAKKLSTLYFANNKSQELSFWYNMEDFSRWLKLFENTFPTVYSEFIINCKNGNPLEDFNNYLQTTLSFKQGEKVIVQAFCFQLSKIGSKNLEGNFLGWLRKGIESNKFSSLKNLPNSIQNYYTDDSFRKKEFVRKDKEVIDLDSIFTF